MIILCSPCNPTGAVITCADAQALASGLLERGGEPVYVLHDEVYRELIYVDDAGSLAQFYPHTIVVNSLSKSNALTGLRLGWTIAPAQVAGAIVKMHAWTTSCAATPAQRIALTIFKRKLLDAHRSWYTARRKELRSLIAPSRLKYIPPAGTFYVCVQTGGDSVALAHRLIDEFDVVTIPGAIFGAATEGWLRLSWVGDPENFATGLERIRSACSV
jgi:aspartate/methionine/tyrosine aminotransferase